MYDGDNHFSHDGKQGRCGMVRDIAGMIMITDLTDVWNCQAHSALPVGQLQKEGAEKPALIYTYICLLFFNSSSYGYHTSAL